MQTRFFPNLNYSFLIIATLQMSITEFHYFEKFLLSEIQTLIDYLNDEQLQYGLIIEIEADDEPRIFILRRLKFDKSKRLLRVKNICHQMLAHHLKIGGCGYALNFDLPKSKS